MSGQTPQPAAPSPVAQVVTTKSAVAPPQSLDAAIKEAMAELTPETAIVEEVVSADDSPALAQVPDDADDSSQPAKVAKKDSPSDKINLAKLTEAVDSNDLPGFLEALGPAAQELLTSKAHKTLRIQVKDAEAKIKSAVAAEQKASNIATKLQEKYSDPIAVRRMIEAQDPKAVDAFLDFAEKTTGADWNSIMKWTAKGLIGRPERLATKAKEVTKQAATKSAEETLAMQQTRDWVTAGIKAKDESLLSEAPEMVDLVIEEIRAGYSRGIDSPAKAIPGVLNKLEAQHAKLTKILAKGGKPAAKVAKPEAAPSGRIGKIGPDQKTRRSTLEEDIAWAKAQAGSR